MRLWAWRVLFFGVVALCSLGVGALLLGFLQGGLKAEAVSFSITGGILLGSAAVYTAKRDDPLPAPTKLNIWDILGLVAFTLVFLRVFFWVVYPKDDDLKVVLWNNMGDLSLHLALINYLAHGAHFWPESPILTQEPLEYSFGVDLINACLLNAGVSLQQGLVWMGLIGSLLTGIALCGWGRGFVLAGFLFNGGFAFFQLFHDGWQDLDRVVDWKSIPLSLFATQRGFLYAFPAGLLLLILWRDRHAPESGMGMKCPLRLRFPFEWLIYWSMPFFHLHTFLFLSFVLAGLGLFGKNRPHAFALAGAAFLPATGIIYLMTDRFDSGKHLGFLPGWLQGDKPFLAYWLLNFGLFLPLVVAVLAWVINAFRRDMARYRSALLLTAIPALILLTTLLVRFAPWAWDNTKLIAWAYLMLLPPIWLLMTQVHVVFRVIVAIALFTSGLLTVLYGLSPAENGSTFAQRSNVDGVGVLVQGLPPGARFAAAPEYNHPLLLNGHPLALGYDGHLMSHGLDYQQKLALLNVLMQGSEGWREAARELGVKYLFWGRWEEQRWPNAQKQWQECRIVAVSPFGTVFDLDSLN